MPALLAGLPLPPFPSLRALRTGGGHNRGASWTTTTKTQVDEFGTVTSPAPPPPPPSITWPAPHPDAPSLNRSALPTHSGPYARTSPAHKRSPSLSVRAGHFLDAFLDFASSSSTSTAEPGTRETRRLKRKNAPGGKKGEWKRLQTIGSATPLVGCTTALTSPPSTASTLYTPPPAGEELVIRLPCEDSPRHRPSSVALSRSQSTSAVPPSPSPSKTQRPGHSRSASAGSFSSLTGGETVVLPFRPSCQRADERVEVLSDAHFSPHSSPRRRGSLPLLSSSPSSPRSSSTSRPLTPLDFNPLRELPSRPFSPSSTQGELPTPIPPRVVKRKPVPSSVLPGSGDGGDGMSLEGATVERGVLVSVEEGRARSRAGSRAESLLVMPPSSPSPSSSSSSDGEGEDGANESFELVEGFQTQIDELWRTERVVLVPVLRVKGGEFGGLMVEEKEKE
ncbi:hypothetical protein JCM8097_006721 [Rhodosporidiobolus ruineniae]